MKQLRCPKCGHEFGYDNGYYDRNIERLGHEIADLNRQMANHRLLPFVEQKRRTDWWLRTKKALAEKQEQLGELKAIRKAADQQIKYAEAVIFRDLVKERLGEKEYMKLVLEAEKEMDAYKISGQMWHEYSRARGQSATNINKL